MIVEKFFRWVHFANLEALQPGSDQAFSVKKREIGKTTIICSSLQCHALVYLFNAVEIA